jgi:hypothetical protein
LKLLAGFALDAQEKIGPYSMLYCSSGMDWRMDCRLGEGNPKPFSMKYNGRVKSAGQRKMRTRNTRAQSLFTLESNAVTRLFAK